MDPAYRPALPRRTSSAPHRLSDASPSTSTVARVVVHPPTPPQPQPQRTHAQTRQEQDDDEQSTSSDGSQPTILRRRGRRSPNASPPQATPSHLSASIPAPTPKLALAPAADAHAHAQTASTKGHGTRQSAAAAHIAVPAPAPAPKSASVLHLAAPAGTAQLSGPVAKPPAGIAKSHSGSSIPASIPAATTTVSGSSATPMVRSKSGQPLKSSLKSAARPALSVNTRPGAPSRSAPSTPTLKSVHFDAQLARVRLFLAGQRPRAVSRDGSPTDTSGTESEFPGFIFGGRGEGRDGEREGGREREVLCLELPNMPRGKRMEADVALEEMQLAADGGALHGRVRVRNLAFEKRLAVRFTFDAWQTTSEVAARYVESPADTRFDIFGFTIRLNDILARIEGKSLLLALRYSVAGREIWDNNGGQNYLARFVRKPAPAPAPAPPAPVGPPKMIPSDSEDEGSGRAIGHLKSKLEQFAQARATPPAAFASAARPPALQAMSNARYDFAAALKQNSWVPVPVPPRHTRTNTYPAAASASPPNTIPFPQKPNRIAVGLPSPRASALGSPALEDALARQAEAAALAKDEDAPFVPRRHTRGYFDRSVSADSGSGAGGVKRTPAGSPRDLTPPEGVARCNSFPPREGLGVGVGWPVAAGGSEESTPAMTSPSTSSRASSRTPSPTEEHGSLTTRRAARELSPGGSPGGGDHYSSFLNRFCFYTGPDAKLGVGEEIPRSHSASSVEAFLMHTPPAGAPAFPPTRSPSYDELASRRSGSTTPTAAPARLSDSRSSTPVAG
ncbi:hypothetical protein HWV62_24828 [Athelia sp. TMB]|nr:hypothetical protein HWV62_24828 [Athelia sp. TMB]